VLSARALLDAVALIDQQLLAAGPEQEQAIEKHSCSGPIVGSVAAAGDAPLQKADVIAYDTALLRQESATVYSSPRSSSASLLSQRQRYAEQLLLLLPALVSWVQFIAAAAGSTRRRGSRIEGRKLPARSLGISRSMSPTWVVRLRGR